MPISDNVADREHDKFQESAATPGQVAIAVVNPNGTNIGGSGGSSMADDSPFTPAASSVNPIGAMFDDVAPDQVDEGDVGIPRMTQLRAMHVNLRDNSGAEVAVGGGTQYDEDTPHVTADKLTLAGVVQQAADTALSGDGDRSLLQVDGSGFLKVNVKAGGAGGTQYAEDTPSADAQQLTMAGVVRRDSPTSPTSADGDRTELAVDSTGRLWTHPRTIAGDEADGHSSTLGTTTDADTALTVIGRLKQIITTLQARLPAALVGGRLDVNLGAAPVTMTVTGPLTDTQLRASAVPVDQANTADADYDTGAGTVNQAMMGLALPGAGGPIPGGTASAPIRTDPTGTTTQPVSAASLPLPTGAATEATLGNIDTDLGAAADAEASGNGSVIAILKRLRTLLAAGLPAALVSGRLDVNLGAAPATLTMPTGASAAQVQGTVAHDGVDAQNPIKIGGKALLNEPTAVADNDRVDAWFDQLGRLVVIRGHANPEPPVTANGSAAGLSVIATPGASLSLYIRKGSMHNSGVEQIVSLRDGSAGTIRFTANLAADGGGTLFDFGDRGWKLTANTALVADIAAATVYVNVTDYYIAA